MNIAARSILRKKFVAEKLRSSPKILSISFLNVDKSGGTSRYVSPFTFIEEVFLWLTQSNSTSTAIS